MAHSDSATVGLAHPARYKMGVAQSAGHGMDVEWAWLICWAWSGRGLSGGHGVGVAHLQGM